MPPSGKSIRSHRTTQAANGSSCTKCEIECTLGVELVVVELPDERRPVDLGRPEAGDGGTRVVDDAVAADRLDAGLEAIEREPQWKYCPPSMTMVWPVTKDEAGPAR